ncbi:hypothetical protein H112_03501 [Trichophyton rubrum D6]|uniref:Fms interacting protein n=5 Tax=Trichophyton TaxID=5550 RepID=A0A178EX26_TRIRU|nr:uncharacterized protein TERG_04829 [Trichophyton rubrum CBS 118892]EZF23893.1 hypothetical protein H100_03505 [Trichophyton rubrum MR850]EZF42878.1 hypothetical protein H102_03500 [Trichophyton rubrum CBS 100081]EZF53527.1 hypothetical protein H103_03510 [Trichophyton rubrum CBS 288.86]EZF64190.1 hypothetical protein H104_03495 [Trichophyton rubrum CBS 289.86]EZF74848.1 hypothetical protein H105_03522 [Trichophyton soudanense CBS 452.61]EZF85473.1 hypothetical protein H110_03507 [Trichophy
MAVEQIVTDPALIPALKTCSDTLSEAHKLIALLEKGIQNPSSNPNETLQDVYKQQRHVYSLLAQLRGLNREAILNVRSTKQATAEARQEIDRLHLQLQNLYYEQRHLSGEIAACESYEYVISGGYRLQSDLYADKYKPVYSHSYLSLPLIPVEEFISLHPEHANSDEHELTIARINHEHAEREKLEQARQELLKKKQALIAENKKRKEDLASLDQDLERFIDAAKPIQKIFEKVYVPVTRKSNGEDK